jgi:hypothetical protein
MAPENITVSDALWRIAELASRSSDPKWRGDRPQAMRDLEAAISEISTRVNDCSAGLEEARTAAIEAGAQARAARGEWDRERARADHWEAKATEALEALAAYRAQAETATADRDDDLRTLRRTHQELSMTRAALASVEAERDEARSALAAAQTALAAARSAQASARAETEMAEARRLAAQKAQRAAETERDAAVGVLERRPQPADIEIDIRTSEELAGSEPAEPGTRADVEDAEPTARPAKPRLINVAATLGHLLPENMDSLLVPGAQVVRREGRLAALVAIPAGNSPWAQNMPELEERQAEVLRTQGFRVEWSEGDRLAS